MQTIPKPERTEWVSARAYPWERDLVTRAASRAGVRVSEYIRGAVLEMARRDLSTSD